MQQPKTTRVLPVLRRISWYHIFPPHDFREHYSRIPTQFPTRDSPVVLETTSQIKIRTHLKHEARHPPCCIRPHAFPRSKGRSTPRTAFPLLALPRHRFSGSKGCSSTPTQVASHQESCLLVLSLVLLLLLLLPLLLYFACPSLLERNSSRIMVPVSKRWVDAPFRRRFHQRTQLLVLAALAADATGTAVPPVDGVASASASDDTTPLDDSRPPTALLMDEAEGTVPLVAGSAANISSDAAATADDAGAPSTDVAEGTVPLVAGAVVNATVASAEAGALAAPTTDAVGKTLPPVAGAAAGTAVDAAPADDAHPSTTQRGRHGCWHRFSRRCCCSKCHCRRRRLLRSLRQSEHRQLHIVRLNPLLKCRVRYNGGLR